LAGVAPGTFFLAGVTGVPLADQPLVLEQAGLPGCDGHDVLLLFYKWCLNF
jgi:hypothetical protein